MLSRITDDSHFSIYTKQEYCVLSKEEKFCLVPVVCHRRRLMQKIETSFLNCRIWAVGKNLGRHAVSIALQSYLSNYANMEHKTTQKLSLYLGPFLYSKARASVRYRFTFSQNSLSQVFWRLWIYRFPQNAELRLFKKSWVLNNKTRNFLSQKSYFNHKNNERFIVIYCYFSANATWLKLSSCLWTIRPPIWIEWTLRAMKICYPTYEWDIKEVQKHFFHSQKLDTPFWGNKCHRNSIFGTDEGFGSS